MQRRSSARLRFRERRIEIERRLQRKIRESRSNTFGFRKRHEGCDRVGNRHQDLERRGYASRALRIRRKQNRSAALHFRTERPTRSRRGGYPFRRTHGRQRPRLLQHKRRGRSLRPPKIARTNKLARNERKPEI